MNARFYFQFRKERRGEGNRGVARGRGMRDKRGKRVERGREGRNKEREERVIDLLKLDKNEGKKKREMTREG